MGRRLGTRFSFRWNNKVASWITVREPLNPKRGPSTQETFTRPHTPTMYAAAAPSFRASRRARPPPRPPPPAASSRAAPLIKSVAAPPRPPRRFHPAAPPRAAGRPRRTTNWPSGRPSRAAARRCGCQLHWRCRLLLLLHGLLHVAHADNRDRVGAPIVFAPTQHARARAPSIRAARARSTRLHVEKYAPQFVRHLTHPTSKNNEVIRMLCVGAYKTRLTVPKNPRTVKILPLCSLCGAARCSPDSEHNGGSSSHAAPPA